MAKGDPKPRRARRWCYNCKKTLQASAFDSPRKSKGDCRVCCSKPKNTATKVGNEFEASVVKAEAERNIRAMREEWALR